MQRTPFLGGPGHRRCRCGQPEKGLTLGVRIPRPQLEGAHD